MGVTGALVLPARAQVLLLKVPEHPFLAVSRPVVRRLVRLPILKNDAA